MDLPPDVSGHLSEFRDGLLAVTELRGLYLYGSLTTGDFSPARSDIDLLAVTRPGPEGAVLDRLTALHRDLASRGGAFARLNCLYVPDGTLADSEMLHTYWFGDLFTQWQVKVMTMAELWHAGQPIYGPWPPPGLPDVSISDVQAATRGELADYWPRRIRRPRIWLQDRWVDFGLITLARSAMVLRDGELVTKSQAIAMLGDFGVPPSLADEIRRRRAGETVHITPGRRLVRAARARQIMAAGIGKLSA